MHPRKKIREKRRQYKLMQNLTQPGVCPDEGVRQAGIGALRALAKEIRELSRAERENGHWKPKAKKGVPVAGQAAGVNENGVAQGLDSYAVNLARDLYCWGFCPQCEKPTEAVGTFQEDQWLRFYHTGSGWDDAAHHLIRIGDQVAGDHLLAEAQAIAEARLGFVEAKKQHDTRWGTSVAAQPYKPPPPTPAYWNIEDWQAPQQGMAATTMVVPYQGFGPGVMGNDVLLGNEMPQPWIPQPQAHLQKPKAKAKPKAKLRIAEIGRKRVVDFDAD